MQTATQTATAAKRREHTDDDRAFFYVDGIPTKGLWIDLDDVTTGATSTRRCKARA